MLGALVAGSPGKNRHSPASIVVGAVYMKRAPQPAAACTSKLAPGAIALPTQLYFRPLEPFDVFGCLRRMISLVILAVLVAAAYTTRDQWLPRVRRAFSSQNAPTPGTGTDGMAPVTTDTGWAALSYAGKEKGRRGLARLQAPKGPAYVSMSAGEFAAAVLDSLAAQLPASTDSVVVRVEGNEFQVRSSVKLGDLGGRAVLGPLASMVGDRERLTLGGILEPTSVPGIAQFKLTRVKVGDFALPGAVVPRLVKALKRQSSAAGVEASALPIRLPAGVGDIRVSQGKVTLYRIIP